MPTTFWSKVDCSSGPDSCWPWLGHIDQEGYGRLKVNGKTYRSQRIAWELLRAPIPDGLVIDHLCRNHACCNPRHMEPVTIGENVRRGERDLVTSCPRSHVYDAANTRVDRYGKRYCRACDRERWHRRVSARKTVA